MRSQAPGLSAAGRIGEDVLITATCLCRALLRKRAHVLTRPVAVSIAVYAWISVFASISLWPRVSTARDQSEEDHAFVVEAAAAGERNIRDGSSNFGPALAVEATPIEEWLELEFGVTALVTSGHPELSSDLIFKKPFRLSPTAEFMIGLGPTVARTPSGPQRGTSHGIEASLDFMFWRSKDLGWYVEPGWSRNSGSGEQSISLNVGLLFGWH